MNFLVRECYLYPVKSCAGLRVDELMFDDAGQIVGDREWVIVDDRNCVTWMGAIPELARIRPQRLPDGWSLQSPGHEPVPLPPAGAGAPCTVQAWNGERGAFDSLSGHDAGDLMAGFVSDVVRKKVRVVWLAAQQHRPNPVHVTTVASLGHLAAHLGVGIEAMSGHRRFRPNVVLDAAPGEALEAFVEERVAAFTRKPGVPPLTLEVSGRCARCIMIDVDPDSGHRDGRYFAGTKQHSAQRHPGKETYFGVYARAGHPGSLATGDALTAQWRD